VSRIRILFVEIPQLLCDVLTGVLQQERDMELVQVLQEHTGLVAAVDSTAADVVILGVSDTDVAQVCGEVVAARPHTKVFAVVGGGRRVFLHEMRPRTVPLGEVSPQDLIHAIRAAVQPVFEPLV